VHALCHSGSKRESAMIMFTKQSSCLQRTLATRRLMKMIILQIKAKEPFVRGLYWNLCPAGLYQGGDWLLFGAETTGLPEEVRSIPVTLIQWWPPHNISSGFARSMLPRLGMRNAQQLLTYTAWRGPDTACMVRLYVGTLSEDKDGTQS
jgi:hypothetical protein